MINGCGAVLDFCHPYLDVGKHESGTLLNL